MARTRRCLGSLNGRATRDGVLNFVLFVYSLTCSTNSYFPFPFILPSAQRFFIASESRLLPAGVSPPRLRFFVELPLGLPMRFLPAGDKPDPRSAVIARLSRSRSFVKSETIFARSKVDFLFA